MRNVNYYSQELRVLLLLNFISRGRKCASYEVMDLRLVEFATVPLRGGGGSDAPAKYDTVLGVGKELRAMDLLPLKMLKSREALIRRPAEWEEGSASYDSAASW
eukprot:scaffold54259_cov17-Tisochrysis_lutea.AAC.1